MGTKGHQREPSSAARKARGVEMLALGEPPDVVAQTCGVSLKTVHNWASEHAAVVREAAQERHEGVVSAVASGSAEARRRLLEQAPAAADVLLGYVNGDEPENAQGAMVRLRAAMTLLDRVGVPVLTKHEHGETPPDDRTLARLAAALRAARDG